MFLHCVLALCSKFLILHRDEVLRSEQKQPQSPLSIKLIKPIKLSSRAANFPLSPVGAMLPMVASMMALACFFQFSQAHPLPPKCLLSKWRIISHNLHIPSVDLSCASNFQVQNARIGTKEQLLEPIPALRITQITLHP